MDLQEMALYSNPEGVPELHSDAYPRQPADAFSDERYANTCAFPTNGTHLCVCQRVLDAFLTNGTQNATLFRQTVRKNVSRPTAFRPTYV